MLGIVLDLIIVITMQAMLEGMSDNWRDLILPVIAITFGNLGISYALAGTLGLFTLFPMALLTVAILMLLLHMNLRNALITTAVIIGVKLGLALMIVGFKS